MDDEKLQRTIEFILQTQSQFYADLQQTQESHKEAANRIGTLERVSLNLYNSSVEQGKNIGQLTEDVAILTKEVRELREAQKETTENLNAVIMMVEKYLSGENGGGRGKEKK